ncbi:helicase-associated domain-containing protein [Micromonospora sp. ATA32]|nr:helicase-associated domain-containing protein [Micromonospora sp. ATA32]
MPVDTLVADGAALRLTEPQAQADLLAVLHLCGGGRLRCSEKTRRPSVATVTAVADMLSGGDFYDRDAIAAFAWPLLVQAAGLAELASGRLQLTARGRTALGKPAAETIRQVWRAWQTRAVLDELGRVEHIKGQRATNVLTSAKTRRQTVSAALAACPPGEWIGVDELFSTMRRTGTSPTVARSERGLWKLYITDAQYGSLGYSGFADWPILEGRYTLAVLFEYAATLGLIDVVYVDPAGARDDFRGNWGTDELPYLSRYDGLRAVRLNALGAYVLGLTTAYQPPAGQTAPQQTLKVLLNFDIVATGDPQPADRLVLNNHAEQTADRVWAVSAATLLAAVDAGRPLDQFVDFLRQRAPHDLPATLLTLVDDVTARAGTLRDAGVVRLIECADPALATLIARDRRLRPLCTPVGDRHVAVPTEHESDFRKALRALGYALPTGGR